MRCRCGLLFVVVVALTTLGSATNVAAQEAEEEGAVATLPFAPGFRAMIEGHFGEAVEAFGAVAAPLDATADPKGMIAAELHRCALELSLHGVTLVPASSQLLARHNLTKDPTAPRDFAVPPYDHALNQIANSELLQAEQTLRGALNDARDPIELAVTRVLHAVVSAWIKNNVVPVSIPASKAEGVVPKGERSSWYGWQVSAIDVGAIGTMAFIGAFNQDVNNYVIRGLAIVSGLAVIAGPAIVHIAHGRSKAGVYSLASRSLLPIAGGLVGALIMTPIALATTTSDNSDASASSKGQYLPLGGALVGAGIGLVGAMAFDSAALSFEPRETPAPATIPREIRPRPPSSSSSTSSSIRPFAFPTTTATGFVAGIGGTL